MKLFFQVTMATSVNLMGNTGVCGAPESYPHYCDNYRSAADGLVVSSASCEICTKVVIDFPPSIY
jgi:hypothetical protein